MYYNATRKVIPLSGDREIIIETGKLAKQADGSVVVKQGNTMLLATVTAAKEPKDDCDFMPLSVEYKENTLPADASRADSSSARPVRRTTRFSCRV